MFNYKPTIYHYFYPQAVHGCNISETAIYMTVALINMALQCAPEEQEEEEERRDEVGYNLDDVPSLT